ncbi:MAG TPA: hypothetical protein VNF73_13945 [Candidatus Saccharimonadales bacterium]|nr:hypothetical protein [Candidatus Saccharimonadales bacterium]
MTSARIVDVADESGFARIPACADPRFDHRSCDYWEDAERGSKLLRRLDAAAGPSAPAWPAEKPWASSSDNPFAPPGRPAAFNPFLSGDEPELENPFLPRRSQPRPAFVAESPRKLALLGRGLGIFGTYAKVLLIDDDPAAYAQFGPLSAYPRAMRLRDLYPQLPQMPLPAVITCIATTSDARGGGFARHLIDAVTTDLAARGFSAVEAYPQAGADPDATSGAAPAFWERCGFVRAVADEHYPVYRRELE